ncbi:hypothetical protein A9K97_gp326 [Tokyovirus A1]|uniref:hypothetical protein n=1 Tax=Tokyovirus A1 TaxID=1826170 RepID=UPI0007A98589|nr:hypothetical protein A9K97_gp326 [Tokyovirus A1]BAU80025.1 conserved hypothetical protein [Tokyovirus A1]
MNVDANAILNLILNSALQQMNLNKENSQAQPQTNNSSSSREDERPNLMDLFEPTPSPPVVSMKNKRQLMALGVLLIHLQENGELPCRVNSALVVHWPENEHGKFEEFGDTILNNSENILGEGTTSSEYVGDVLNVLSRD